MEQLALRGGSFYNCGDGGFKVGFTFLTGVETLSLLAKFVNICMAAAIAYSNKVNNCTEPDRSVHQSDKRT